jgi:UDP-N-acetylglucosamine 2-epimerase (non-hydrolysing)
VTDSKPRILVAFGTRPEAIKLAPVIARLRRAAPHVQTRVCVTAQHRDMLDQVLSQFRISVDHDLDLMQENQDLFDITEHGLRRLRTVMEEEQPDLVLVQGDTTTTFVAALAAYYLRIPVAHVEAGLRTGDRYQPFPEEANRRLTDALATLLFAPTEAARRNLLSEGIDPAAVFVTGNTAIDALLMSINRQYVFADAVLRNLDFQGRRVLLVTAHRRESFGAPLERICAALRTIAQTRPDVEIVFPVHPNPNVGEPIRRALAGVPRVHLMEPLDYEAFVQVMDRCFAILTDSGGIQEEAPSLGKPVLVLRESTERQEAVDSGSAVLVGTDADRIVQSALRLLDGHGPRADAARCNPFGDGHAAERIVDVVSAALASPAWSVREKAV